MAIARTALPLATWAEFDYWAPEGCATIGALVRVPLARRSLTGVVVELPDATEIPPERLQPIIERVQDLPALPEDLLVLARFVSRYYQQPLGLVLAQMIPPITVGQPARQASFAARSWSLTDLGRAELPQRLARLAPALQVLAADWLASGGGPLDPVRLASVSPGARRTLLRWAAQGFVEPATGVPTASAQPATPALNPEQRTAVAEIVDAQGFAPMLLQGVTGSGKTEVYLEAAAAVIAAGRQTLLLVPEINLTPQLEARVRLALRGHEVVTLHSRLAAGERRRAFSRAAAGKAALVIGTRLAVFTPMPHLGLVVVDEEHDGSYKQQDNVRYHARDVAIWRARQRGVPIVLGSATPALETLVHARAGRYRLLTLTARAVLPARLPAVRFEPGRTALDHGIGPGLAGAIADRLQRREQSLVFVNRRGFAPSLLCGACGWRAECPHCSARLVVHRDAGALRCHHCGHAERLPRTCPGCGNVELVPIGHGTQRLELALRALFPQARIARVDRDSTQRKGAFAALREEVHAGAIDILVGTQMLAKGHDFPRLTLVGVLGADNALYSADFRATERLGALLFQVAGRAGRADLPGEVIVQTDFPGHALYQALAAHDYDRLADAVLVERQAAGMPPFSHLVLLAAEAPARDTVDGFLQEASRLGREQARVREPAVEVFAPVAATLARRAGMERGQVVAQSADRAALQRFLPGWREAIAALPAHRVRWAIDVDPIGIS